MEEIVNYNHKSENWTIKGSQDLKLELNGNRGKILVQLVNEEQQIRVNTIGIVM